MKNFLSVGDVCKIKKIHVNSLRYYEKIGLLIPVYVNPETKYRYYSYQQMMILDLILFAIQLDIPLKEAKEFIGNDGVIDMISFQRKGEEIVNQKIQALQNQLAIFDFLKKHCDDTKIIMNQTEIPYKKQEKKRHFYCIPYEHERFSLASYEELVSRLKEDVLSVTNNFVFEEGLVYRKLHGKLRTFAFIQLDKAVKGMTTVIPSGCYDCEVKENTFELTCEIKENKLKSDIFVCRFLLTDSFHVEKQHFEVQRLT